MRGPQGTYAPQTSKELENKDFNNYQWCVKGGASVSTLVGKVQTVEPDHDVPATQLCLG